MSVPTGWVITMPGLQTKRNKRASVEKVRIKEKNIYKFQASKTITHPCWETIEALRKSSLRMKVKKSVMNQELLPSTQPSPSASPRSYNPFPTPSACSPPQSPPSSPTSSPCSPSSPSSSPPRPALPPPSQQPCYTPPLSPS